MRSTAARQAGRITQLPGLPSMDEVVNQDLMKLRAVLILSGTPRGLKVPTARQLAAELRKRRVKSSQRSLFHWQERYLRDGFAGIARRRRSDFGQPRQISEEILLKIVKAAARVRFSGDIRREYRQLAPPICYETFRNWVRRLQGSFGVIEMPVREERLALFI
jgi:hypothetical protein